MTEYPKQAVSNPAARDSADRGFDLSRRIEEASINAWPSLHQVLHDGWLLRFSQGFTKRANCVVPLYPSQRNLAEKIRHCENLYARERLATIFRLTDAPDLKDLAGELSRRGYQRHDATDVLALRLNDEQLPSGFRQLGHNDWLTLYTQLTGLSEQAARLHGLLLRGIRTEICYGAVYEQDQPVACGLAVVEHSLVGLFDVVTASGHRRRGYGRHLVKALGAWGQREGAESAYLQVVADNSPAQHLYAQLGYGRAHRYHYYSKPEDTGARSA